MCIIVIERGSIISVQEMFLQIFTLNFAFCFLIYLLLLTVISSELCTRCVVGQKSVPVTHGALIVPV